MPKLVAADFKIIFFQVLGVYYWYSFFISNEFIYFSESILIKKKNCYALENSV